MYEQLFVDPNPAKLDFATALNPGSLTVCHGFVERAIVESDGRRVFNSNGRVISAKTIRTDADRCVFNRTVALRDSFGG